MIPLLMGGANAGDVTPAAVDWADITGSAGGGAQANANQTISGITQPIMIQVDTVVNIGAIGALEYRIDSGSYVVYSVPFQVNNGQTLNFRVTPNGVGVATYTVKNNSAGGTTLDPFTATFS